jgi:hypothetical protein
MSASGRCGLNEMKTWGPVTIATTAITSRRVANSLHLTVNSEPGLIERRASDHVRAKESWRQAFAEGLPERFGADLELCPKTALLPDGPVGVGRLTHGISRAAAIRLAIKADPRQLSEVPLTSRVRAMRSLCSNDRFALVCTPGIDPTSKPPSRPSLPQRHHSRSHGDLALET